MSWQLNLSQPLRFELKFIANEKLYQEFQSKFWKQFVFLLGIAEAIQYYSLRQSVHWVSEIKKYEISRKLQIENNKRNEKKKFSDSPRKILQIFLFSLFLRPRSQTEQLKFIVVATSYLLTVGTQIKFNSFSFIACNCHQ